MKYFFLLLLFLGLGTVAWGQNAEIEEIKQALSEADNARERMVLRYELAEAYLRVDDEEAEDHAKAAFEAAKTQGNDNMAAQSAYMVARALASQRNTRNQDVWLRNTLNYAKEAGDVDLIMQSVRDRSALAVKDRNYRRAYEINQEAYSYFSQNGTSISELQAQYERQRRQIEQAQRSLQQEKDQLEFEIRNLRSETDQLSQDKSRLESRTSELSEENAAKEEELQNKEEELSSISAEKQRAEQAAQERAERVSELTEEVAKTELLAAEAENERMKADLKAKSQEIFVYTAAGIAGILLLLALLLYNRFAAKRRSAESLAEKNKQIEAERERSDELLLNILPASIADELKTKGKAQAKQYPEATVLFSDFINFTNIAERLTPEELVQELDKCFKGFDFIISQYKDIEKIKTIGDAYMCASGLSDRKTMPNNIVRAALEMQAFLDEQKQERMRLGKPYFEARIGIHTGPVVAGVVGVKKFAYDIWGDTVNTAARMEANSEAGKVNISETTYGLIKYDFEVQSRGKVEAKNKGLIDMYYVQRALKPAAV